MQRNGLLVYVKIKILYYTTIMDYVSNKIITNNNEMTVVK